MDENLKFNSETNVLTVNPKEGVVYKIRGEEVSGEVPLKKTETVRAFTTPGYVFGKDTERVWTFEVQPSAEVTPEKTPETQVDAAPAPTSAGGEAQNPAQGSGLTAPSAATFPGRR